MKYKFVKTVSLFAACGLSLIAAEQTSKSPLHGMWQWKFTMPDGSEVSPVVKFRTKDGELVGTSRFRLGSEKPLANIKLKGSDVSFDVVRDYEGEKVVTHYSGKLSGNAITGKITSKSHGEEQAYDWDAKRLIGIDGAWRMYVDTGGDWPQEARFTLKQEGEKVTGKISQFWREADLHHGRFKDGKLSFEVEVGGRSGEKYTNRYHGRLTNDAMVGRVEMNRSRDRETNEWSALRAN
ncbi:MAG TPA: hypothetical protein VGF13_11075 [Verrucomicrobiae bacterium]|jgi:hypothetical protein